VTARSPSDSPDDLLPDRFSDRVARGIRWYTSRLLRRRFHAVRGGPGTAAQLRSLDADPRPAILLLTHASWWDPLVGIHLWDRFFPSRRILGPMRRQELEQFGFFRRVGVFGVDPDRRESLEAMRRHVLPRLASATRDVLILTPQGVLSDPRAPVVIRPGAAAIAAALPPPGPRVLAVAIEYGFWADQRPELFVESRLCEATPRGVGLSTADWHRAMGQGLQAAAAALAERVISRDPSRFETWSGGRTAVHPVYDLWLRVTGRHGRIDADLRSRDASAAKEGD
jgi:hypothetical protein